MVKMAKGPLGALYQALMPPSAISIAPVVKLDWSEAR
jgi:hypothetical protein